MTHSISFQTAIRQRCFRKCHSYTIWWPREHHFPHLSILRIQKNGRASIRTWSIKMTKVLILSSCARRATEGTLADLNTKLISWTSPEEPKSIACRYVKWGSCSVIRLTPTSNVSILWSLFHNERIHDRIWTRLLKHLCGLWDNRSWIFNGKDSDLMTNVIRIVEHVFDYWNIPHFIMNGPERKKRFHQVNTSRDGISSPSRFIPRSHHDDDNFILP